MKKAIFTNKTFYFLLIAYIAALLIYNIYMSIKGSNIYGLLPITIQIALLIAIVTKNRFTKQFVLFWTIIFLTIGNGLIIAGKLLEDAPKLVDDQNMGQLIYCIVTIIISILIIYYSKTIKTVTVNEEEDVSLT